MNFTLSTKPLADALDLGVIPSNISKYFKLSCLAQLTATAKELRINLQASNLCTELTLRGTGDAEGESTVFVDCLILKQIIGTLDSNTIKLEFTDGGLIIHSGTSKLTLPQLADATEGSLVRPSTPDPNAEKSKLDLKDWKFIKDYQMYAVALSFAHPIYMNVWVGESGDVIVGDYDNSLFTFSKKNKLGKTCLLTDTIINLFNTLPEGSEIILTDKTYIITVHTDAFDYISEFSPKYENDNGIGDYCSDEFLKALNKDANNTFKVAVAPIAKFLSQSELLSSGAKNSKLYIELANKQLSIKDDNIDCKVGVEGNCMDFKVPMNADLLKPVIGHVDSENISICPVVNEGSVDGLIIWTDSLSVILGAVAETA